tara:strand:- start:2628 stop:3482 length:855 start_codon:yes stop_codon:yes gene_type:complete
MNSQSDIIPKITNYFNNMTFYQKYNTDIWLTVIIISLFVFLIMYVCFLNAIQTEKLNWEENKCNPFYMLLGSQINNKDYKFNEENLKTCLNTQTKGLTKKIFTPIDMIFNIIQAFFASLSSVFSIFMHHMAMLLNIMYRIFVMLMKYVMQLIAALSIEINKVSDGFNTLLAGVTDLYNIIMLTVNNIKLLLPMGAMAFFGMSVIPTIIAVSAIAVVVAILGGLCAFPFTAPVACPIFAIFVAILVIMYIFLIVILVIYAISAETAQDILAEMERRQRASFGSIN